MNYEELKQSLDNEIERMEEQAEKDSTKMYTVDEVLAKLYAIRDCE